MPWICIGRVSNPCKDSNLLDDSKPNNLDLTKGGGLGRLIDTFTNITQLCYDRTKSHAMCAKNKVQRVIVSLEVHPCFLYLSMIAC